MAAKKKPAARKAAKKAVKPIPAGYRVLTPYLAVDGAAAAIDYYKKVFGARVRLRMDMPGGKIGHAELVIGDSVLMLADEFAPMEFLGPKTRGGTTVSMHMYVKDCDAVVAKAVAAGATLQRPVADQFYGDRNGTILDPFGHSWSIATHKEDLTAAQMRRRGAEAMKKQPAS
jgi:PhnB protein